MPHRLLTTFKARRNEDEHLSDEESLSSAAAADSGGHSSDFSRGSSDDAVSDGALRARGKRDAQDPHVPEACAPLSTVVAPAPTGTPPVVKPESSPPHLAASASTGSNIGGSFFVGTGSDAGGSTSGRTRRLTRRASPGHRPGSLPRTSGGTTAASGAVPTAGTSSSAAGGMCAIAPRRKWLFATLLAFALGGILLLVSHFVISEATATHPTTTVSAEFDRYSALYNEMEPEIVLNTTITGRAQLLGEPPKWFRAPQLKNDGKKHWQQQHRSFHATGRHRKTDAGNTGRISDHNSPVSPDAPASRQQTGGAPSLARYSAQTGGGSSGSIYRADDAVPFEFRSASIEVPFRFVEPRSQWAPSSRLSRGAVGLSVASAESSLIHAPAGASVESPAPRRSLFHRFRVLAGQWSGKGRFQDPSLRTAEEEKQHTYRDVFWATSIPRPLLRQQLQRQREVERRRHWAMNSSLWPRVYDHPSASASASVPIATVEQQRDTAAGAGRRRASGGVVDNGGGAAGWSQNANWWPLGYAFRLHVVLNITVRLSLNRIGSSHASLASRVSAMLSGTNQDIVTVETLNVVLPPVPWFERSVFGLKVLREACYVIQRGDDLQYSLAPDLDSCFFPFHVRANRYENPFFHFNARPVAAMAAATHHSGVAHAAAVGAYAGTVPPYGTPLAPEEEQTTAAGAETPAELGTASTGSGSTASASSSGTDSDDRNGNEGNYDWDANLVRLSIRSGFDPYILILERFGRGNLWRVENAVILTPEKETSTLESAVFWSGVACLVGGFIGLFAMLFVTELSRSRMRAAAAQSV